MRRSFFRIKNIFVVGLSTSIAVFIMFVTLVGYDLYLKWKSDTFAAGYRFFIYRMSAELFEREIEIGSIKVNRPRDGIDQNSLTIEGKVSNNSKKIITSVLLEYSFLDTMGTVIHKGWFYPLEEDMFGSSPFFSSSVRPQRMFAPGEILTFRHLIRKIPSEIKSFQESAGSFARKGDPGKVKCEIALKGLSVI
ncbi:MAG: hypothetical protein HQL30_05635 [Candidatus Omnitrophica bacterium]|nr:hypothetical protein [Candidatus Omnitrophota bacterium]